MKIGFIGAGNMGGAIIKGIIEAGLYEAGDITASDVDHKKIAQLATDFGISVAKDNAELIKNADTLVLAIKPQYIGAELQKNGDLFAGKALISIAAGWTTAMLKAKLPETTRILRIMPNTPALVGAGMSALCLEHSLTNEEADAAQAIFSAFGEHVWVSEKLMDGVIGVSGSGPAYVFMFIEAMADGGVLCGLPRATAYKLAAQTVLGAAKMVMEAGDHPGALKDNVCSPGGTTIAAVKVLEEKGFRGAVMNGVIASCERSKELSK